MSVPGLFVVGTDTGVGKTHVAAAIVRALAARGLKVGVFKPVASGGHGDAAVLSAAQPAPVAAGRISPLVFQAAAAPCLAARREGKVLRQAEIDHMVSASLASWERDRAEALVVEGVGGLLCPLADDSTVADLAVALDYPLVIVARRGLGTLNHTMLTVEAARWRGLRIAGLVLNAPAPETDATIAAENARELARRLTGVAVLAEVDHDDLSDALSAVDWAERLSRPRFSPLWNALEESRDVQ